MGVLIIILATSIAFFVGHLVGKKEGISQLLFYYSKFSSDYSVRRYQTIDIHS